MLPIVLLIFLAVGALTGVLGGHGGTRFGWRFVLWTFLLGSWSMVMALIWVPRIWEALFPLDEEGEDILASYLAFCAIACFIVGSLIGAVQKALFRPPAKGMCQSCGYNLTGNVSGVCPECGVAIP